MKIGIFLPNATFDLPGTPEVGGIETFAFAVGEALQRLGHTVVLFGGRPMAGRKHRTTTLELELHPYIETQSIPDIGTRFQRLIQRLHFGWSIRKAWKRQRCDVVLLAKPFDWPLAARWKKARPELKTIMGFHGEDYFAGDRFFYGAVDAAFAVSARVADLAERRLGHRPVVMPNPVDVDFFTPGEAALPPRDGPWRLVTSGRLVGFKGFPTLIEAVALLRDRHGIPVRLEMAGEGRERGAIESRIAQFHLEDAVTLHGLLDASALREMLRRAELFVMPSIGLESFSISALEGACVGLPLLLSDQVGLRDYLDSCDFLSYAAGSEGLAGALRDVYARRNETAWTDRAARHARIRGRFSAERVARAILELVS